MFANNASTLCKHCKLSVQILRKYFKNIKNMTKKFEIPNKSSAKRDKGPLRGIFNLPKCVHLGGDAIKENYG